MNIELLPAFPTHMRASPWLKPTRSAQAQAVPATQLIKFLDYALYRVSQSWARQATPGTGTEPANETQARQTFINQLAQRLNHALPNPNETLSHGDLLDNRRLYTLEGACFFLYHCGELLGESDFVRNAMMWLVQNAPVSALPLTTSQRYLVLTPLLKNQAHGELTVQAHSPHQVIARWRCPLLFTVSADLQAWGRYLALSQIEGLLLVIPTLSGLPLARLTENHALSKYGDYQEWLVTWPDADYPSAWPVWVGAGASAILAVFVALGDRQPWAALPWLSGWPLTLGVVWYAWRRIRYENMARARTLQAQLQFTQQYHQDNQTNAQDILAANYALTQRVAELSAMQAIGLTLSGQQPLDVLLDTCLNAVVTHLDFDRALILLKDADCDNYTLARYTSGYTASIQHLASQSLELPSTPYLEQLTQGQVVWLRHPQTTLDAPWQALLSHETQLTDMVIAPMIARGRLVGMLLVDNGLSQTPLPAHAPRVLLGVANQMANAIENHQLYQTLEQRVHERTAALEQATRQAEHATASKSQFLAFMSHEIRNPLSGISGAVELLSATTLSEFQQEMMDKLAHSTEALKSVINNVLDLSKIEAQRMELVCQPMSLSTCIESALDLVTASAVKKNLELAYVVEANVPTGIWGDFNRLRQVLLNLIGNAIKFTDQGGVTVRASACPTAVAGQWLMTVAVRDTGVGIPLSQFNQLFQAYSQLDTLPDRKNSGTGLGLVISQQLARLMGGELRAESAGVPGQGSTFYLSFTAPEAELPASQTLTPFEDLAALAVLSHPTHQEHLRTVLTRWKVRSVVAQSLAEAQAQTAATHFKPNLAVVDWQLAGPDPENTVRQLYETFGSLPIVLINASLNEPHVHLPGVITLSRPLRTAYLHQAFVRLLALAPSPAPTPTASLAPPSTTPPHSPIILLVEDNQVNQVLAKRMLQLLGQTVETCNTGREAVNALRHKTYDLVLMDLHMPEMDGLEATEYIRSTLPARQQPRILAMTANAMPEDRDRCLKAGMDDFMVKPISLNDLRQCLLRWLPDVKLPAPSTSLLSDARSAAAVASPIEAATTLDRLVEEVGPEAAQSIIGLYLKHAPQLLADIEQALSRGDRVQIRALAHQWRGSSGNLGLRRVQVHCIRLESQALGVPLSLLTSSVQALSLAHTEALNIVRPFYDRLSAE